MMANLLRSEFRKIRSTRMWWGLTLGGAGIVVFYVAVITFTAGSTGAGSNALHSLSDPGSVRLVYGVPFLVGYLMPLVMGILLIGGEYRHKTITPTFLATPKRGRVLAAKTVAAAATGLVMGVVFTAVAAGAGAALIAARGYPVRLTSDGVPRLLALMVLGLGVWAVFGVGIGALLKNQVAAIITAIAFMTVVDGLLVLALRWAHLGSLAKVLPSSASSAIIQPSTTKAAELLPWWGGALALLAWGVIAAVLGSVLTLRRDVT